MKKLLAILYAISLVCCMAGAVVADYYQDIVDWNNLFEFDGYSGPLVGFQAIDDTNLGAPHPFTYTHDVEFLPPAQSIESATLTLRHWGNLDGPFSVETWILYEGGGYNLGELQDSGLGIGWISQDFVLPFSLYDTISGSNWSIGFKLKEETGGWLDWEFILLDYSVLHGNYIPIPDETSSGILFQGTFSVYCYSDGKYPGCEQAFTLKIRTCHNQVAIVPIVLPECQYIIDALTLQLMGESPRGDQVQGFGNFEIDFGSLPDIVIYLRDAKWGKCAECL